MKNCKLCGSTPKPVGASWWACSNPDCRVYGPSLDHDGRKWDALMSDGGDQDMLAELKGILAILSQPAVLMTDITFARNCAIRGINKARC